MSHSGLKPGSMARHRAAVAATISFSIALAAGCGGHPSDEQIQQQAAQTTQQVKQGAQQAASTARVAAAKAEDKINAVAAGVRQGLRSGPAGPVIDLNSASRDQLVSLPGISAATARKIIAGRPYASPNDLVSRKLVSQVEFDRISVRLAAN